MPGSLNAVRTRTTILSSTVPARPGRRRHRLLASAAALVMAGSALGFAPQPANGAPSASATGAPPNPYSVLSNGDKAALDLQIMTKFVPFSETFWRTSDIPDPDTGRFLATGAGVTQPRGTGNIDYVYATLLTARPDAASFGGVPRATLLDHLIRSIRYTALTNVFSGAGYNTWGAGNTFEFSLETYLWGDAAYLIWDQLDADTQALVKRVVTSEANLLVTTPAPDAAPGDTGGETSAWDAPTPALAAVMFPDDPNRTVWEQTAIRFALNASSIPGDKASGEVVDGKPLSDWITTSNLNPDLTLENHGFYNITYQMVTHLLVNDAAIFYGQAGLPQPQALSFRTRQIWDSIIGPQTIDDGDIVPAGGQDWVSKDFQHLDYLGLIATRFQVPAASVLESRALQLVARRQDGTGDGSIAGESSLGYESMMIRRVAGDFWDHQLFTSSPSPTQAQYEADYAAGDGVHSWPDVSVTGGRLTSAFASMSWDSDSPMAVWVPRSRDDQSDPVTTLVAPTSLFAQPRGTQVGAHSCACASNEFATAGTIGSRDVAMAAFADGTTLLLDRGTGPTFNYYLDQIPNLTGPRPVYSSGGQGAGALPGNWVDVGDKMAMIVAGGGGITANTVTNGTNADSDDTVLGLVGSAATGSGNRGAALLPDLDHQTAAQLAAVVSQPSVPDGWSALAMKAPDDTDRLAVARWSGPGTTPIAVGDVRGAPVPIEAARLDGTTATFSPTLAAPAAEQETLRFFVRSDGQLQARQDGENRAVLTNLGTTPAHSSTTYVAPDGTAHTASRVIAPGETTVARVVGGRLTLAGAEYAHLLSARSTVTDLQASIASWRAEGRITTAEAERLTGASANVIDQLADAIGADTAQDPDTNAVAASAAAAQHALTLLRPGTGVPADIRNAIDEMRQAAGDALTEAGQTLSVVLDVRPLAPALSGEPLTLRVTMLNRGQGSATGAALTLKAPAGWTLPSSAPAFDALPPGASTRVDLYGTVAPDTATGADITATVSYTATDQSRIATNTATIPVQPLFTIAAAQPSAPLARGGWNEARFTLANNAAHPLDIDLTAQAPAGVSATLGSAHVTVPASGTAAATVVLTNAGQATGTGQLTLTATTSTHVSGTGTEQLLYSDNLALNPVGAPFPAAFADSSQTSFPPRLAVDGGTGTFWVSGGPATAGNGPTPQHPVALGVNFGASVTIASVTMTPRSGYGPTDYSIQTSADGQTWTTIATVTSAPNAAVTTAGTPTTAPWLRLLITGSHDATNRNVQVAELSASAP